MGSPDLRLKSEFPPSYNPSQHLRNSGSKKSSANKETNLLFSSSKEKDRLLQYQAPSHLLNSNDRDFDLLENGFEDEDYTLRGHGTGFAGDAIY